MATSKTDRTFEDLNLSNDEVKRLGEALKDEKFRKMLVEYAEEISDPENRRKAEEEIAMMEGERGMDVEFIHPKPGYVMKTTVDGSTKAFINICQNDKIEKPKAKRETGQDGKSGMMWQIPHSFAPPKEDIDKAKNKCQVFDVVFNPDTFRMAQSNARFKKLVEDTATDGIQRQFKVSLDTKNIKYPKMDFKGTPTATVIRTKKGEAKPRDPDDIVNKMPYPYGEQDSAEKAKANMKKSKSPVLTSDENTKKEDKFTEPKYTITHRSNLDMGEYRNAPDARPSTRPKELVVKIELPLIKSAGQVSLDIFEKKLTLESITPAAYKLDLDLPFPVNDDDGTAKFDKSKRTLIVTLPVIPETIPSLPFGNKEGTDDLEAMEGSNPNASPLIEVLTPKEESYESNNPENRVDHSSTSNEAKKKQTFPQHVKWCLPEYQFSQDNETISLVINVQSVEEDWIETKFPFRNVAVIKFMSMGSGCFPVYYSIYAEFPENCLISQDHCTIDTSAENLVFVILKEKDNRGPWDSFKIGVDESVLETKQFLTECNLQHQLSSLQCEAPAMPVQDTPDLHVSEMNTNRLTIDIKPLQKPQKNDSEKDNDCEGAEDDDVDNSVFGSIFNNQEAVKDTKVNEDNDDDDDDSQSLSTPSSAEIEVVHWKSTPANLHGILKQRTMSETSDISGCDDPSSPRSGDDVDPLSSSSSSFKHRSVSFNKYVDSASFKSSEKPSAMHAMIRCRRRRQKKRDMKSGRNSSPSASEGSSNEYHSQSEEELDYGYDRSDIRCQTIPEVCRTSDIPDQSKAAQKQDSKSSKRNKKRKGKKGRRSDTVSTSSDRTDTDRSDDQHEESASVTSCDSESGTSISNSGQGFDFRTMSEHSKQENCVNAVISGKKEGDCDQDNDLDSGFGSVDRSQPEFIKSQESVLNEKNKKIVSEIKSKMMSSGGGDSGENVVDDSDDDLEDASAVDCEDGKVVTNGGGDVCVGEMNGSVEREQSDVSTMLSWEDTPAVNGGEHATKCGFSFSNALMFDLDVD